MATENSSFLPRKIKLLFVSLLFLTACRSAPKATSAEAPNAPMTPPSVPSATKEEPTTSAPAQPLPVGVAPKIGLILGPGALRSYAHVGVVQEFAKQKMPIHAIAGIEMGSLVAAIYANKGQPYDVEWQMMKLKESDVVQKGLLSGDVKPGEVKSLHEFINLSLSSSRAENAKVAFACPALNLDRQQVYMMNRGAYSEMLPFCLALPPLFKSYQQNVSGVFSLRALIDHLRAKGATSIIYVDLLSGPVSIKGVPQETQILWSLAAESLNRPEKGIDYVIHVPMKDFDLLDFNRRREMIQKGQQAAQEASAKILKLINW